MKLNGFVMVSVLMCISSGAVTRGDETGDLVSPETTVRRFLTALKVGDSTTAQQLLSRRARTETKRCGLTLAPPGDADAQFTIGVARSVGKGRIHLGSTWTDNSGLCQITWLLRREVEEWRIMGMRTRLESGMTVSLDFENPKEMMKIVDENHP